MPASLLRWLDTWLGLPLVWGLRLFCPAPQSLHCAPLGGKPRKVVCCKLMGLGSTVLALPLLHSLREAGIEMTFLCFSGSADFLRMTVPEASLVVVRPSLKFFL